MLVVFKRLSPTTKTYGPASAFDGRKGLVPKFPPAAQPVLTIDGLVTATFSGPHHRSEVSSHPRLWPNDRPTSAMFPRFMARSIADDQAAGHCLVGSRFRAVVAHAQSRYDRGTTLSAHQPKLYRTEVVRPHRDGGYDQQLFWWLRLCTRPSELQLAPRRAGRLNRSDPARARLAAPCSSQSGISRTIRRRGRTSLRAAWGRRNSVSIARIAHR